MGSLMIGGTEDKSPWTHAAHISQLEKICQKIGHGTNSVHCT